MKNKHTKGEWKAIGLEIRHKDNSMILATVYKHLPINQGRDEAIANAKLIAAAPEMLEALLTIKSVLKEWNSDGKYKNIIDYSETLIQKATL